MTLEIPRFTSIGALRCNFALMLKHTLPKKFVTATMELKEEEFVLHPLKFLFQKSNATLICADLHIGKSGHFRTHGIALPTLVNKNNFWNLMLAFEDLKPQRLLVLGDMMHSRENDEWNEFADFLDNYPSIQRMLVRGNHEICNDEAYQKLGFEVVDEKLESPFHFIHETDELKMELGYQFSGHIHPAIGLSGAGRQHLRLPCFWFGQKGAVLPASGSFTGMHTIKPLRGDRVFAISGNEVIEVR